jgi:hypothetical protein
MMISGNGLDAGSSEARLDGGLLDVNGPITVDAGGVIQSTGSSSAAIEADSLSVYANGIGGEVQLLDQMTLNVTADLTVTDCIGPARGCTPPMAPPIFRALDSSAVTVGGRLLLSGAVAVQVQAATIFELGGNFDNQATDPLLFDWESGPLTMNGSVQFFELAGEDRGPNPSGFIDNFALGTLRIEAGRTVDFVDTFDNFVGPGCEALYVHTLSLGAGSTINLHDCNVYYESLIDEGATIESFNGGALVCVNPGDINCDGSIDLDDSAIFIGVLLGSDTDPAHVAACDLNGDGSADGNDIQPFVGVLMTP